MLMSCVALNINCGTIINMTTNIIVTKNTIDMVADIFSFLIFLHRNFCIELTNRIIIADQINGEKATTKELKTKITLSKFAHKK